MTDMRKNPKDKNPKDKNLTIKTIITILIIASIGAAIIGLKASASDSFYFFLSSFTAAVLAALVRLLQ